MAHDLSGYEEVPDRIARAVEKYPDLSLQGEHRIVEVGGKIVIEYVAYAYRNPEDPKPGRGVTWEPYPGTTPYTKNSEVENAETSAWGRALAAIGFTGKKIATKEEVENAKARQGAAPAKPEVRNPGDAATDPQKRKARQLLKGRTPKELAGVLSEITGLELAASKVAIESAINGFTKGQASAFIDRMQSTLPRSEEHPSDVPNDFVVPEGAETLDDVLAEGDAGLERAA